MAIEFVKCRRIDNSEVTADIAVTALPHLAGWERIPEEELRAAREAEQAARLTEVSGVEVTKQPPAPETESPPTPEQGDTPARPATRKSRSRAATEEEGV